MARKEKKSELTDQITKMKGEMVQEVRRSTRKSRPWLACGGVLLLFLLAVLSWIAWIVAATGMVDLPIFTGLAYEKPEPERVVEPGVSFETVVEEQFRTTLIQRLQAGGGELQDNQITIEANERSLTASFQSAIEEAGLDFIDAEGSQVSVHADEGLRLFLPVKDSELETALQVYLRAEAIDGTLNLVIDSVQLGSLAVPSMVIVSVFEPMLKQYIGDLNRTIGSYASIDTFSHQEEQIEMTGTFSVEILEAQ